MTQVRTTVRTLSKGDTVTLGSVIDSQVQQQRGGSLRFIAVHDGEEREYVVLTARFEDSESIQIPDDGQVLAVTDGNQRANPVCWMLVPKSAYGGGSA